MKRKNVLIILGLVVFIALVGGISYALFTYNKDVADVSLTTGDISINLANINGSINLSNVIPKSNSEGIKSTDYIDFTVNATVDTERIYYEVYILPKSGNTLNTAYLKTYLTDQSNNVIKDVATYSSLTDSEITGGKAVYRGLIDLNNNQTVKNETKNFRLRLWLDENYPDLASKTFNFDIYLYAKNVASNFRLNPPICTRVTDATKLHTETCSQTSDYCAGDGYTGDNTLITYGNAKALNTQLAVGDAFDCDVNGDGIINKDGSGNSTERFYYVSEYYNTDTKSFDTSTGYATLIYYSNTYNNGTSVVVSDSGAGYATLADIQAIDSNATSYDNWHGPVTAIKHLPTTSTWSNITLKTTTRTILACDNGDCSNTPVLTTNNGSNTITNPFSYVGKAARLLTVQEIKHAGCDTLSSQISLTSYGSLTACNFLFEGTKYASSSKGTYGPWLETPHASTSNYVWNANARIRYVNNNIANYSNYGVRPAIDVPYSELEY